MRPLELAAVARPQFDPNPVLGTLLALARIRVEEVQVTDDDADSLEDEGLEHETT